MISDLPNALKSGNDMKNLLTILENANPIKSLISATSKLKHDTETAYLKLLPMRNSPLQSIFCAEREKKRMERLSNVSDRVQRLCNCLHNRIQHILEDTVREKAFHDIPLEMDQSHSVNEPHEFESDHEILNGVGDIYWDQPITSMVLTHNRKLFMTNFSGGSHVNASNLVNGLLLSFNTLDGNVNENEQARDCMYIKAEDWLRSDEVRVLQKAHEFGLGICIQSSIRISQKDSNEKVDEPHRDESCIIFIQDMSEYATLDFLMQTNNGLSTHALPLAIANWLCKLLAFLDQIHDLGFILGKLDLGCLAVDLASGTKLKLVAAPWAAQVRTGSLDFASAKKDTASLISFIGQLVYCSPNLALKLMGSKPLFMHPSLLLSFIGIPMPLAVGRSIKWTMENECIRLCIMSGVLLAQSYEPIVIAARDTRLLDQFSSIASESNQSTIDHASIISRWSKVEEKKKTFQSRVGFAQEINTRLHLAVLLIPKFIQHLQSRIKAAQAQNVLRITLQQLLQSEEAEYNPDISGPGLRVQWHFYAHEVDILGKTLGVSSNQPASPQEWMATINKIQPNPSIDDTNTFASNQNKSDYPHELSMMRQNRDNQEQMMGLILDIVCAFSNLQSTSNTLRAIDVHRLVNKMVKIHPISWINESLFQVIKPDNAIQSILDAIECTFQKLLEMCIVLPIGLFESQLINCISYMADLFQELTNPHFFMSIVWDHVCDFIASKKLFQLLYSCVRAWCYFRSSSNILCRDPQHDSIANIPNVQGMCLVVFRNALELLHTMSQTAHRSSYKLRNELFIVFVVMTTGNSFVNMFEHRIKTKWSFLFLHEESLPQSQLPPYLVCGLCHMMQKLMTIHLHNTKDNTIEMTHNSQLINVDELLKDDLFCSVMSQLSKVSMGLYEYGGSAVEGAVVSAREACLSLITPISQLVAQHVPLSFGLMRCINTTACSSSLVALSHLVKAVSEHAPHNTLLLSISTQPFLSMLSAMMTGVCRIEQNFHRNKRSKLLSVEATLSALELLVSLVSWEECTRFWVLCGIVDAVHYIKRQIDASKWPTKASAVDRAITRLLDKATHTKATTFLHALSFYKLFHKYPSVLSVKNLTLDLNAALENVIWCYRNERFSVVLESITALYSSIRYTAWSTASTNLDPRNCPSLTIALTGIVSWCSTIVLSKTRTVRLPEHDNFVDSDDNVQQVAFAVDSVSNVVSVIVRAVSQHHICALLLFSSDFVQAMIQLAKDYMPLLSLNAHPSLVQSALRWVSLISQALETFGYWHDKRVQKVLKYFVDFGVCCFVVQCFECFVEQVHYVISTKNWPSVFPHWFLSLRESNLLMWRGLLQSCYSSLHQDILDRHVINNAMSLWIRNFGILSVKFHTIPHTFHAFRLSLPIRDFAISLIEVIVDCSSCSILVADLIKQVELCDALQYEKQLCVESNESEVGQLAIQSSFRTLYALSRLPDSRTALVLHSAGVRISALQLWHMSQPVLVAQLWSDLTPPSVTQDRIAGHLRKRSVAHWKNGSENNSVVLQPTTDPQEAPSNSSLNSSPNSLLKRDNDRSQFSVVLTLSLSVSQPRVKTFPSLQEITNNIISILDTFNKSLKRTIDSKCSPHQQMLNQGQYEQARSGKTRSIKFSITTTKFAAKAFHHAFIAGGFKTISGFKLLRMKMEDTTEDFDFDRVQKLVHSANTRVDSVVLSFDHLSTSASIDAIGEKIIDVENAWGQQTNQSTSITVGYNIVRAILSQLGASLSPIEWSELEQVLSCTTMHRFSFSDVTRLYAASLMSGLIEQQSSLSLEQSTSDNLLGFEATQKLENHTNDQVFQKENSISAEKSHMNKFWSKSTTFCLSQSDIKQLSNAFLDADVLHNGEIMVADLAMVIEDAQLLGVFTQLSSTNIEEYITKNGMKLTDTLNWEDFLQVVEQIAKSANTS